MLIPIQAEYYALEGLGQLLETVEMVRTHLNQDLVVSTILITMYDSRTNLAAGVAAEVREHFRDQVLRTAIPRSVRVSEAPSYGQSVMTYDPGSPGALSYLEAARELAQRGAPGAEAAQNGAHTTSEPENHRAASRPEPTSEDPDEQQAAPAPSRTRPRTRLPDPHRPTGAARARRRGDGPAGSAPGTGTSARTLPRPEPHARTRCDLEPASV